MSKDKLYRSLFSAKKINIALALLVFLTSAVFFSEKVLADSAYSSGGKIKYGSLVYTNAGKDTRSGSTTSGWTYYLPPNFQCGLDVIVDNPATIGTVAVRKTESRVDWNNPILGECWTLAQNKVLDLVSIGGSASCTGVNGTWVSNGTQAASYCNFMTASDASRTGFPLASDCYTANGATYNTTDCPANTALNNNCLITHPPLVSFERVNCNTGVPVGSTVFDGGSPETEEDNNNQIDAKTVKNDCQGDNLQAGATGENHCGILDIIQNFINFLSAAVGIVIVGSLIVAGIRYSSAGSDAQKVSAAKNRILNTIIALMTYLFFFSFLQWIIPGGLF